MKTHEMIHTFAASDTHRLTEMMKWTNLIVEKIMCKYEDQSAFSANSEQKVKKITKNWDQLLFKVMHTVNHWHIKHLEYTLSEILYRALPEELLNKETLYTLEKKEGITSLITSEELNTINSDDMTVSVTNFMRWRKNKHYRVQKSNIQEKKWMKEKYDHSVFNQHLKVRNLVMLWRTEIIMRAHREQKMLT